jgi:hypothetical protein
MAANADAQAAFPAPGYSPGTQDMIRAAREAGLAVRVVQLEPPPEGALPAVEHLLEEGE